MYSPRLLLLSMLIVMSLMIFSCSNAAQETSTPSPMPTPSPTPTLAPTTGPEPDATEEKTEFTVILKVVGNSKINVIKAVREVTS